MSSAASTYPPFFRRRTIGRASSPPTWACYEQIPYDDDDSDSASDDMSCSEDGEDYGVHHDGDGDSDSEVDHVVNTSEQLDSGDTQTMELDEGINENDSAGAEKRAAAEYKKDVKGKQRAIEPEVESTKRHHRKKQRQPVYALRPILTIQKSQGFVWNQDLFVPPYIKDRYVASTSPPNSGFISTSASSTNSALTDYEIEVVEIRVKEGELEDIIP